MSYTFSTLPPALLDLTLIRVGSALSTRLTSSLGRKVRWNRALGWRGVHEAAVSDSAHIPGYQEFMDNGFTASGLANKRGRQRGGGALTVRNSLSNNGKLHMHPVEKLEQRVQALEQAIETEGLAFRPFFYTEEELAAMYQDVLAVPIPEAAESNDEAASEAVQKALAMTEAEDDSTILNDLYERLCLNGSGATKLEGPKSLVAYRHILLRAHEIVSRAEAARQTANPNVPDKPPIIPIGVLSLREFEALVRISMDANDFAAGEIALDIAKIAGLPMPITALDKLLKIYTSAGNAQATDKLLATFLTDTPTAAQRHLHVQAHLNATPNETLPTSALELLHQYEAQNAPVPMRTYTSVITALFSRPSSLARAHAWDLFTHMRYVAHPTPDALLYGLMIRACASPVSVAYSSEPEKALDLWTEMTVDNKIAPTVGSYNAVILACAKSGSRNYINEGFRLARQMLDSNRDAHGYSAFRPDRKTFCALLEGAKRIGDLARARWILAEMVRGSEEGKANSVGVEIDDEIMMHMFHAYAAYRPPFIRSAAPLVSQDEVEGAAPDPKASTTSVTTTQNQSRVADLVVEEEVDEPSFAHIPPQSHAEVIREVRLLFNRILRDHSGARYPASASLPFSDKKFSGVELSPRLIGSYLSVFYKHSSLETAQELFRNIFDELEVTKTPRVVVDALERCANARRGPERQVALRFSDELWGLWIAMENAGRDTGKPVYSRVVERAHVARLRVLAVTENISQAMTQLRSFAARYPPDDIRTPSPKLPLQSTRTSLVGQRPLVRMTSSAEVPDDNVPPLLTFRDIEVLHHRLIMEERPKDIGYITWLCKAYEWALRVRRDEAVKARFPRKEKEIATTT
ncbi:hypothetical protein GALMADRAFT_119345 [Galerina marginata CBS 339.88]|uniref:Pentacotripeptide-repeat region of PRORP domain-containing protein n=1 Tax=Galerina marginata (strain CBS 339.88) TaxID=685588 RepID=A0A067TEI5_GALM3|nr:hypothetical protein GALMADRAFT_119345 [Galerina marginata CBS 339.88]